MLCTGNSGSSIASSGTLTTGGNAAKSPTLTTSSAAVGARLEDSSASFSSTSLEPVDENREMSKFSR